MELKIGSKLGIHHTNIQHSTIQTFLYHIWQQIKRNVLLTKIFWQVQQNYVPNQGFNQGAPQTQTLTRTQSPVTQQQPRPAVRLQPLRQPSRPQSQEVSRQQFEQPQQVQRQQFEQPQQVQRQQFDQPQVQFEQPTAQQVSFVNLPDIKKQPT